MRLVWSPRAIRDLRTIRAYIALENPTAAQLVAHAIETHVQQFRLHPRIGRSRSGGYRETVEPRYRYVVRYDLIPDDRSAERVLILSIWHPKQSR